jgi:hypothetical protein
LVGFFLMMFVLKTFLCFGLGAAPKPQTTEREAVTVRS